MSGTTSAGSISETGREGVSGAARTHGVGKGRTPGGQGQTGAGQGSNSNNMTPGSPSQPSTPGAASVDYVRDGALAAHKKMSGALLSKLGIVRTSPEPTPTPTATATAAAGAGARSGMPSPSSGADFGGGAATATGGGNNNGNGANTNGATAAATAASVMAAQHAEAASKVAMLAGSTPRRAMMMPASINTSVSGVPNAIVTPTGRSRKGSLRKNILQRGSIQRMETILSPRAVSQMSASTDSSGGSIVSPTSPDTIDLNHTDDSSGSFVIGGSSPVDYLTPRISYDWSSGREKGVLHLDNNLASGSLSRSSTLRDNSTTDEDEKPAGGSGSAPSPGSSQLDKKATSTGISPAGTVLDSYFPSQPGLATGNGSIRRRSPMARAAAAKITKSSPLSALPLDAATAGNETGGLSSDNWDYGETERWGWTILVVTWITFVVGMGSCFDAWSWAWDVGSTPYAPPELEDDPTLPIVGYYPALMVLTCVMAWVWVVIAWVGMKYFKHAKMAAEDG